MGHSGKIGGFGIGQGGPRLNRRAKALKRMTLQRQNKAANLRGLHSRLTRFSSKMSRTSSSAKLDQSLSRMDGILTRMESSSPFRSFSGTGTLNGQSRSAGKRTVRHTTARVEPRHTSNSRRSSGPGRAPNLKVAERELDALVIKQKKAAQADTKRELASLDRFTEEVRQNSHSYHIKADPKDLLKELDAFDDELDDIDNTELLQQAAFPRYNV